MRCWRREETRTRRATRHANIGFSVRTFGPSARETFIRRFISAIRMDGDGWEKGIVEPLRKELCAHRQQLSLLVVKFRFGNRPTDAYGGGETWSNDVKTRAKNLLAIGHRGKSRDSSRASPRVAFARCLFRARVFIFIDYSSRRVFGKVAVASSKRDFAKLRISLFLILSNGNLVVRIKVCSFGKPEWLYSRMKSRPRSRVSSRPSLRLC